MNAELKQLTDFFWRPKNILQNLQQNAKYCGMEKHSEQQLSYPFWEKKKLKKNQ